MSDSMTLNGKVIVAGEAEGEALVATSPVSFLGMVNTEAGTFIMKDHELEGACIAGKILIYPFGKGSSGDAIRMWRLDKFGKAPAAILFDQLEPIHVQGAMLLDVPSAHGFEKNICEAIKTGDWVHIKDGVISVRRAAG